MKIRQTLARRPLRIQIVPLIDIIFFLLATFMICSLSMIRNEGILVRLPQAATGEVREKSTFVTVTVTEKGDLFLDKEKIKNQALHKRLQALKKKNPQIKALINADQAAPFGIAVKVLDVVRQVGIETATIQTTGAQAQ